MIINLLAGGPQELVPSLSDAKWTCDKWVGIDRGVFHLLNEGIRPVKAFGDFDSVSQEELYYIQQQLSELEVYPAEKDKTDLELALEWAMDQNPTCIRIFGGTGGRMDHGYATIQLLYRALLKGIASEIVDQTNIISMHEAGRYTLQRKEDYQYVSFLPFSDTVENITLVDFKYPLTNQTIKWGSTLCVSNELLHETGTFSFTKGILMMIRSND
ncbi:thiamine diphosphokinase [Priestia koreensis]|uniref:thiamine diphosphokinase n=1 Tax=Priestia koreensis TaxID=284581 RepID=UPI003CFCE2CB